MSLPLETTGEEAAPFPELVARLSGLGRSRLQAFAAVLLPLLRLTMDIAAVGASLVTAFYLRYKFGPVLRAMPLPAHAPDPSAFIRNLGPCLLLWTVVFVSTPELQRGEPTAFEEDFAQAIKASGLGSLGTLALSFLLHQFHISRLMILMLPPVSFVYLLSGRQIQKRLYSWLVQSIRGERRVLILGKGKAAAFLKRRLSRMPHVVGRFGESMAVGEALRLVEEERLTDIILTQVDWDRKDIFRLADICEGAGIEMKLVPNFLEERMGELQIDRSMALPMFRFHHLSLSGADAFLKRCFDVLCCALLLAVLSVPVLLICLLIKLDSAGPVFFKQRRVGYKGRAFDLYKFRTMVINAQDMLDKVRHLNQRQGPVFKIKHDPRVTRVGRWLRRLSLDELPQLFNVLRGEMSLVGPRPPLLSEVRLYDAGALKRLNVLPGITGLWQVSGRADLDFNQMIALDLYYLEHWSFALDLKIILKTPAAVLSSRGAY